MNDQGTKIAKTTETPNNEQAMEKLPKLEEKTDEFAPIFVEAEKMLERLAQITKETTQKAFEYFQRRGGEYGRELDDWFKAESDVLLPVPVDVNETKDQINVRAGVPGFKPEEIEVSVKDKTLILSGKTETEEKKEDENTIFREWRSNRFCRRLPLSSEVDADKVTAKLKNGVLKLKLPKIQQHEAKNVSVEAA